MEKQDCKKYTYGYNVKEYDTMNHDNETQQFDFYKYRGTGKCISEGISFITDNFVTLLFLTSPISIPLALIISTIIYNISISQNLHSLDSIIINISFIVIAVLVVSSFESAIFNIIKKKSDNIDIKVIKFSDLYTSLGNSISKTFTFNIILIGIFVISYVLCSSIYTFFSENTLINILMIGLFAIVLIVTIINIILLTLSLPWIVLGEDNFIKSIINGYKHGMKHLGKLFSLNLIIIIITLLLILLLMAPTIVIFMIYHSITVSKIVGDNILIPDYFDIYAFIIILITVIMFDILLLLYLVPTAYMYASIKFDIIEEENNNLPIVL